MMNTGRNLSHTLGSQARKLRAKFKIPVNQKLIQFGGIQRSGNHAIINWIIAQEELKTCFINGTFPTANPWEKNWGISYPNYPYWPKQRDVKGQFVEKDLFLISYENRSLQDIEADKSSLPQYIGVSRSRYTILVLRDPYNTFASWLKRDTPVTPTIIKLWKEYAYEFLGKTSIINGPKVCVNFNLWFSDQKYRQSIAEKLELTFTDKGLGKVSHHGGGQSLQGKAKNMAVLTRFNQYQNHPVFRKIFDLDPELEQLSKDIFGELVSKDDVGNSPSKLL